MHDLVSVRDAGTAIWHRVYRTERIEVFDNIRHGLHGFHSFGVDSDRNHVIENARFMYQLKVIH